MKTQLQFLAPHVGARMTGAQRSNNCYREGKCPSCGRKAFKVWRGDTRTMVWCFCCQDNGAIFAALRQLGYTTIPDWRPRARRPGVKFDPRNNGEWERSPSFGALTRSEIEIDLIIKAVVPDEDGLRLITKREIEERVVSPHLVKNALRVLKAVFRWEAVKVPFIGPGGRIFYRNGYREGQWKDRFLGYFDDPDEPYLEAKQAAKDARHYRLHGPANSNLKSATRGHFVAPLLKTQ
jgi:hypothetical protein